MDRICLGENDSIIWSESGPLRRDTDKIEPSTSEFPSSASSFRYLIQSQRLSIYASDQHMKDVRQTIVTGSAEPRKIIRPERDFESFDDLITFLLTKEPPPENFMSIEDSLEHSRPLRKPFRFFHRQNSKKIKQPRQILLPDSAVAAKTTQGHWHIAITIPSEYDPLKLDYQPIGKQIPKKELTPIYHDGPITILKPAIMDTRPPRMTQLSCPLKTREFSGSPSGIRSDLPVSEAVPLRTFRFSHDHGSVPGTPRSAIGAESTASRLSRQKSDTGIAVDTRSNKHKDDLSHSSGAASRGKSTHTTESYFREAASIPTAHNGPFVRSSAPSIRLLMDRSKSDLLSTNAKMVETASGYNLSNVTGSRYTFAMNGCSLPPNKKLPDLPGNIDDRRSIKSRLIRKSLSTTAASFSQKSPRDEGYDAPNAKDSQRQYVQSRQEFVKALRSRDMAASRASIDGQTHLATDSRNQREPPPTLRKPETESEYQIKDENRSNLRNFNSLTPIMVVIDSEPVLDLNSSISYNFPSPPRNTPKPRGWVDDMGSTSREHTQFFPVKVYMSGNEDPCSLSQKPISTNTQDSTQVTLPTSSSDATSRLQPTLAPSLETIEGRLKNIEHSNALLLQALNTVVRMGFSYLNPKNLISRRGIGRSFNPEPSSDLNAHSGGDLGSIESLMKELQEAARVSLELRDNEVGSGSDNDLY